MSRFAIQRQDNTGIIGGLIIFAVVIRLPMNPGECRAWFEVLFEIALAMAFAGVLWGYNKWVALFLILTVFSAFWPHYGPMSYLAWRAVFNGCLWYYIVVKYLNMNKINMIYDTMIACAIIHVFMGMTQFLNIESLVKSPFPVGLMANPIEFSALIVFCLPAFFREGRFWLIPIPFAGLIISGPFLGMASGIIGICFYLFMTYPERRKIMLVSLPIGIFSICLFHYFFIDEPAVMVRVLAWKIGFAAFLEHWILGAGVGHWKALFYKIPMPGGNKVWLTAHNEYLQMLFELGIGFAIILAGYLFNIVKRMNFKTSILPITALIVIMVQSSANFVFHIAPTAMIALTWMAILERTLSEKTDIRSGVGEMRNTVSVQSA